MGSQDWKERKEAVDNLEKLFKGNNVSANGLGDLISAIKARLYNKIDSKMQIKLF